MAPLKPKIDAALEPLKPPAASLLGRLLRASGRDVTDDSARRWFRRYWTFGVGSRAHVLVNALLDVVRETAESVEPTDEPPG